MDEFFKFVAPGLPDKSEKGGPGSGHHGHAGRPGLRGGSAPEKGGAGGGGGDESRGEDNLAYQEMVKGLDLTKGFTVSLHGVSKKAGKSVSPFPQHGITIDPDDFNRENVYKWIDKVKPVMLKDERIHYGGWENSDDGLFYLDLSILVRSRSEAAEICRKHNQIAFYDLDTGEEIRLKDWDMGKFEENISPEFKGKKEEKAEGSKPVRHVFDRGLTDDEFVDAIEKIAQRMKKERDEKQKGVGK